MADRDTPGRASSTGYGPASSDALVPDIKLVGRDNYKLWDESLQKFLANKDGDFLRLYTDTDTFQADSATAKSHHTAMQSAYKKAVESNLASQAESESSQQSGRDTRSSAARSGASAASPTLDYKLMDLVQQTWKSYERIQSATFTIILGSLAPSVKTVFENSFAPADCTVFNLLKHIRDSYKPIEASMLHATENEYVQILDLICSTMTPRWAGKFFSDISPHHGRAQSLGSYPAASSSSQAEEPE